jgi:hypothetical protein
MAEAFSSGTMLQKEATRQGLFLHGTLALALAQAKEQI